MRLNSFAVGLLLSVYFVLIYFPHATTALGGRGGGPVPVSDGPTVRKDERWPLVSSEFGEVSAVKISDGKNGCYYLHFITMNPCSLFLPVYLHSEMLLYVNSGNGTLSWINVKADDDDKLQQVVLKRGDIFRLTSETVFYLQNNVDEAHGYHLQNLQIYAIFPASEVELQNDLLAGAYTPVHDLVLGFDNRVLQSTLSVPEEVIEELRGGENQPLIVDAQFEISASKGIRALIGTNDIYNVENKKKKKKKDKMKAYNVFNEDHDVDTCFGWSVVVTSEELDVLKDTNFGVFMVNLAKGSMMAPHWTPDTVEIAIVLHGQGVIEVVCPGIASETKCENSRLMVEEGDVFVVPRAHPMAQMSYNNDSFVFMGFMLKQEKESPQYLAGKLSILQRLDRKVLAKSFNVRNTTIDWILSNEKEDIIYECVSCAEEGQGGESPEERGGCGGGWQEEEGGRSGRQERGRGGGGWREEEGGRGGWQAM
ncbi:putative rmlC-like cupin domain superfamily, rmlC-like jelly roll protein [Helianthus annuus]|nr:putative rmlC-like cupin domain superfamily, rmlC-like jelly roll protein [Helianthus annuus]